MTLVKMVTEAIFCLFNNTVQTIILDNKVLYIPPSKLHLPAIDLVITCVNLIQASNFRFLIDRLLIPVKFGFKSIFSRKVPKRS